VNPTFYEAPTDTVARIAHPIRPTLRPVGFRGPPGGTDRRSADLASVPRIYLVRCVERTLNDAPPDAFIEVADLVRLARFTRGTRNTAATARTSRPTGVILALALSRNFRAYLPCRASVHDEVEVVAVRVPRTTLAVATVARTVPALLAVPTGRLGTDVIVSSITATRTTGSRIRILVSVHATVGSEAATQHDRERNHRRCLRNVCRFHQDPLPIPPT